MIRWKELERTKGKLGSSPEKRDEARAISTLAGMVMGSALGLPISIAIGLLGPPGSGRLKNSYDFPTSLIVLSSLFGISILIGFLIAFATCAYLWKREGKVNLRHCAASSLTLLVLWTYILLIFTFLFVPLNNFLLQCFSPFSVFWYIALAFLPFMLIITYIEYPSIRPRIRHQLGLLLTRAFWSDIRRNPKRYRKMLFLTAGLVVITIVDILTAVYR